MINWNTSEDISWGWLLLLAFCGLYLMESGATQLGMPVLFLAFIMTVVKLFKVDIKRA